MTVTEIQSPSRDPRISLREIAPLFSRYRRGGSVARLLNANAAWLVPGSASAGWIVVLPDTAWPLAFACSRDAQREQFMTQPLGAGRPKPFRGPRWFDRYFPRLQPGARPD